MSDEGIIGSVGVAVVPNAEDFWRRFIAQTSPGAQKAGRDVGRQIRAGMDEELGKPIKVKVQADADTAKARAELDALDKQGKKTSLGLIQALVPLAPALVPLAGAATAGGAALVAFGASGILAIKGVKTEMTAGTAVGQKYGSVFGIIKRDLGSLENTAAVNTLNGVSGAIAKVNAGLPTLNTLTAKSSQNLGSIVSHLAGAAVGGLQTFSPLILKAETDSDNLAASIEKWASSDKASHFVSVLSEDLDHALPALASLGTTVVHVFTAVNEVGGPVLDTVTAISKAINDIPTGVLTAALTGYIAFRTAVLVTTPFTLASAALTKFAASETLAASAGARAAAVGGAGAAAGFGATTLYRGAGGGAVSTVATAGLLARGAGVLSTVLSKAIPIVGTLVATDVILNTAAGATKDWITAQSSSSAKSQAGALISGTAKNVTDILTGHWSSIFSDDNKILNARNDAQAIKSERNTIGASTNRLILDPRQQLGYDISKGVYGNQFGAYQTTASRGRAGTVTSNITSRQGASLFTKTQAADTLAAATANKLYEATLTSVGQKQAAYDKAVQQFGASSVQAKSALASVNSEAGKLNAMLPKLTSANEKAARDQQLVNDYTKAGTQIQKDRFAAQQAYVSKFGTAETVALATTTGNGASITQSTTALSSYQTQLATAIKNEQTWTTISDDKTIKDKWTGQTYELSAYNLALKQTNGNQAAAFGLLEAHSNVLATDLNNQKEATREQDALTGALAGSATKFGITTSAAATYATIMGVSGRELISMSGNQDEVNRVVAAGRDIYDNSGVALTSLATALTNFGNSEKTAADKGALIAQTLVSAQGDTLSYASSMSQASAANQQFVTDFDNAKKGVVNLKTGVIDFRNAGAAPLLQDLSSLQSAAANAAAATYQYEVGIGKGKDAAKDAAAVFRNDTTSALVAEARQLGLTKDQAQKLSDEYFHLPASVTTDVEAIGTGDVVNVMKDILADLDAFTGNHHSQLDLDVSSHLDGATQALINLQVKGGGGAYRNYSSANGNLFDFYANGGMRESHVAQIAPAGAMRVWAEPETGGEAYIPLAASKRTRSRAIAMETVRRLGGAAFFAEGGYVGVTAPQTAKQKAAAGFNTSLFSSLLSTIVPATSALVSAEKTLLAGVKAAGGSKGLLAELNKEGARLLAYGKTKASLDAKLTSAETNLSNLQSAMASEAATVKSAFMGLLNTATVGVHAKIYNDQPAAPVTSGSILKDITANANQATTEATQLAKLRKEGLSGNLLGQFAADPAGSAAQIAALASGPVSDIKLINAQYKKLGTASSSAGTTASQAMYAAGVNAAKGLVSGLKSQESNLEKTMSHLADTMVNQIKKDLGIHSPSKVLEWHGRMAAQGVVKGIVGELPAVRGAASRLAGSVTPDGFGSMGGVRADGTHYHAHGIQDPGTFLAVARQNEWMRAAV